MSGFKVCSRSGSLYQGKCGCPQCQAQEQRRNQAKLAKRRLHGRNLTAWQKTRTRVLQQANHECQLRLRGCTRKATTVHRTDHRYHNADLTMYQAACAHCHGVIDAPRAQRRTA